jgi:hypothetical protein
VKVDYQGSIADKTKKDSFAWVKITAPNGRQGYVSGKYVRSPSDYHACFRKVRGKWYMTVLAAGD